MSRRTARLTLALCALLLAAALAPALGQAAFNIKPGSVEILTLSKGGELETAAGSHPDRMVVNFGFESSPGSAARDLRFEFPPGLTGSPLATKVCSRTVFELEDCPNDTEVGKFVGIFKGSGAGTGESFERAVYNIEPAPDQVANLAFHPLWLTELEMRLRPSDFGLDIATYDMPQLPIARGKFELWGVPADHNKSGSERKPFLSMPTDCGPIGVTISARSWDQGAPWVSEAGESAPFVGCQNLPFQPSLGLRLDNPKGDAPTGVEIDMNLAEHNGPDETAGANMRNVHIDLPPGMALSPAGTEGREACSDAQFGLGTGSPVSCPFRSRVGSVEVSTPQLAESLVGSMYLGQEKPGERFRLFIEASARGVEYKALAKLTADSTTGQLSTEINGLPAVAINQIAMKFEGGPRALLVTPVNCGPVTSRARFTPSGGGAAVNSSATVSVGPSCSPPFGPVTTAGVTDPVAGRSSGFSLTLARQDGEQLPKRYSVSLPLGVSANLTAVDICPSATAARAACPAASKIGAAVAEVGTGPTPAQLPGTIYLTGPYDGAPFGLSIPFHAAIGPFDLGTLNIQVSLRIDPHTGQVTLAHQLPTIFEGVPVRFRNLALDIPSGFLIDPTQCEPQKVSATVGSVDGRSATTTNPFYVGDCDKLKFNPKFSVGLNQKGARAKNPDLSFGVRTVPGQTNLKRFAVDFPPVVKFHSSGFKELCPRADALEDHCRPRSQVGTALAKTPILGAPLSGPVYLVQPQGKGQPDLWATIQGLGVKLQMQGDSSGKTNDLITEIVDIPDLPLSSFEMHVNGGGKNGTLFTVDSANCSKSGLATSAQIEAQQGTVRELTVPMKASCSQAGGKKRSGKRRAHSRGR